MGIRWGHLLVAVSAGVLSWTFGNVGFWTNLTTPLISVLSILAAAVFVRLARGVAVGSTDAISLEAARKISQAMKKVVRALRALLFVIISTMILIIFAPKVLPICKHFWPTAEALPVILDKSLSAAVGFLLAFVFARVIAVVQSDVDITDLQAENLTLSAAKRQGDHTEKVISSGSTVASTGTERYGRLFQ